MPKLHPYTYDFTIQTPGYDFIEFHFDYDLPRRYMRYSGNGIDMGWIIAMWINL